MALLLKSLRSGWDKFSWTVSLLLFCGMDNPSCDASFLPRSTLPEFASSSLRFLGSFERGDGLPELRSLKKLQREGLTFSDENATNNCTEIQFSKETVLRWWESEAWKFCFVIWTGVLQGDFHYWEKPYLYTWKITIIFHASISCWHVTHCAMKEWQRLLSLRRELSRLLLISKMFIYKYYIK